MMKGGFMRQGRSQVMVGEHIRTIGRPLDNRFVRQQPNFHIKNSKPINIQSMTLASTVQSAGRRKHLTEKPSQCPPSDMHQTIPSTLKH